MSWAGCEAASTRATSLLDESEAGKQAPVEEVGSREHVRSAEDCIRCGDVDSERIPERARCDAGCDAKSSTVVAHSVAVNLRARKRSMTRSVRVRLMVRPVSAAIGERRASTEARNCCGVVSFMARNPRHR